MIHWYDKLYTDEYTAKRVGEIKQRIEDEDLNFQIYCIAFASNENNLFDIINVNELLFNYYKRNRIYIVGLASCKSSAYELTAEIIQELYENTNSFNVREYLKFS